MYRPLRVYQWGSLLHPEHFSEISDIDIALEGLSSPEEYFAILGDVMNMSSFPWISSIWGKWMWKPQRLSSRGESLSMKEKVEFDWDRLEFLIRELREAHPVVLRDMNQFPRFLKNVQPAVR